MIDTTDPSPAMARYRGYAPFSYTADRRTWSMAPQLNRVAPYDLELSEEQQARTRRLLRDNLIFSMHDHVVAWPDDISLIPEYQRHGRLEVAYEGLAHSGLDVVVDNIGWPAGVIMSQSAWKWEEIVYDIGMRLADVAQQDFVVIARSVDDIARARDAGQVAMVLGVEGAGYIENELDRVDVLYGLGIRQLGLAYNGSGTVGGGMKEAHDGGLTQFGRRVVRRANELGLALDLSHAGDRTSLDAIRLSQRPVMITHAGARGLWPSERLKPDKVLLELAASGGLLGIEAAPHTTLSPQHPAHSIASVMDHFEYCIELMGVDNVGFGPDTIYGDHAKFHLAFAHAFARSEALPEVTDPDTRIGVDEPSFERVEYCAGMENPTENFHNIIGWLVKRGYSDDEIAKVTGANALRVYGQAWGD